MGRVAFGLGLIGIGKPWGFANPVVPTEGEAVRLLERAFELGVRYFDTAPSYGVSEERLGRFLRSLTATQRAQMTVATKFGEHWDFASSEPFVDQGFDALRRSLDESAGRLGKIDVLQLHKTTPEVLMSGDLGRAWEYASSLGIARIGASVSDPLSARLVLDNPAYRVIQLPYNARNQTFGGAIGEAAAAGLSVIVNRPFGMGKMLYEDGAVSKTQAFQFVLEKAFQGVILSGTKSVEHLEENWRAFQEAEHPAR
jgi:aryl-alcohol dehydrogenase-like predicted oxidoreductase